MQAFLLQRITAALICFVKGVLVGSYDAKRGRDAFRLVPNSRRYPLIEASKEG
jgi:hypothetical protein